MSLKELEALIHSRIGSIAGRVSLSIKCRYVVDPYISTLIDVDSDDIFQTLVKVLKKDTFNSVMLYITKIDNGLYNVIPSTSFSPRNPSNNLPIPLTSVPPIPSQNPSNTACIPSTSVPPIPHLRYPPERVTVTPNSRFEVDLQREYETELGNTSIGGDSAQFSSRVRVDLNENFSDDMYVNHISEDIIVPGNDADVPLEHINVFEDDFHVFGCDLEEFRTEDDNDDDHAEDDDEAAVRTCHGSHCHHGF
ncbi:uncharacterized protein LOC143882593 [Tasmannia lanceolata]|uniref:uncharacterized protein LOC143882593 n=1 Tax=Tasmannia lanceolata TaxID=3420 RepID=UPI004062934D